jgi:hypothetical protein
MEGKCKKVDFTKVAVENIEGKVEYIDYSKQIGNVIYSQTKELGEVELARDIYKNGIVNLTKEQCDTVMKYFGDQPYFIKHAFEMAMKFD